MHSKIDINSNNIHDIFIGFNSGMDIRRHYNCPLVVSSVAEYFVSGVLRKPLSSWYPLDLEENFNLLPPGSMLKPFLSFNKISISLIECQLLQLGKGSHAIVGAYYSPTHPEGKYLFGMRNKDWGHYFNIYHHGGGKFSAIDAYSSSFLEKSKCYNEYIKMYTSYGMCAFFFQG